MELQRLRDGRWEAAPRAAGDNTCVDLYGRLRFGRVDSELKLDPALPNGTYRLAATDVERGKKQLFLTTDPFVVESR